MLVLAQAGGGLNLIELWGNMGNIARGVAFVLVIMSMWSFGVAIERYYTFMQARKQSKLYAPQVAKHLKDGRLKDAVAVSQAKTYQYSHLAKVVLAGLQEYQFQQDGGGDADARRHRRHDPPGDSACGGADLQRPQEGHLRRWPPSAPRRRSSDCSARSSASSTRSTASRPPARAVSARCPAVFRKRSSRPRSVWSWRSRRSGCTTTSRAASSTSTSRWTTPRRSSWTTSSRRRHRVLLGF